jgi:hypothetical protein
MAEGAEARGKGEIKMIQTRRALFVRRRNQNGGNGRYRIQDLFSLFRSPRLFQGGFPGSHSRTFYGHFVRVVAKIRFVIEISDAASRTSKFPGTGPHKVTQITLRIERDRVHPENDVLAALRVFALDPKLYFCGHVTNPRGRERELALSIILQRTRSCTGKTRNPRTREALFGGNGRVLNKPGLNDGYAENTDTYTDNLAEILGDRCGRTDKSCGT